MTLPALHNTGVLYRRILSQFPQDISLAFAYGSGVFKQHGTNQGQMEVSETCPASLQTLPVTLNLYCNLAVQHQYSDIVVSPVWTTHA